MQICLYVVYFSNSK